MTGTGTGVVTRGGRTTVSSSPRLGRRIARTPGFALAALLVLAVAAFAILAGVQTARLRRIPADQLAPQLAPGDRIVAVAGTAIAGDQVARRMTELPVSGEATTVTPEQLSEAPAAKVTVAAQVPASGNRTISAIGAMEGGVLSVTITF